MAVSCVSSLPAEPEVDADLFTETGEVALHDLGALSAELLFVIALFVDRFGGGGVEVEGVPGRGKCVGGVGRLVLLDGEVKTILAYITPTTERQ